MNCDRARSLFSSYLDGAVSGHQMQAVSQHLGDCAGCQVEYAAWRRTQRRWQGLLVRIENLADAFMLPAMAGLVSAIVFFGVLIGFMAMPVQLSAARDDVPTLLYTPPRLQAMPSDLGLQSAPNAEPVVVETLVDANGRVQDYRILSGPPDTRRLEPQLNNIMIFTTFQPATTFGVPTPSRAVLSFAKINVGG